MAPDASIDAYLAARPAPARRALAAVRKAIRAAVKGGEDVISYSIPAYRLPGGVLLYYAAWKSHVSLYPATAAELAAVPGAAKYRASKGTLHFPLGAPMPVALIARVAKVRAATLAKRAAARKRARAARATAKPRATAKTRATAKPRKRRARSP